MVDLISLALLRANARAADGNTRRHAVAGNHPIGEGDIGLKCSVTGS